MRVPVIVCQHLDTHTSVWSRRCQFRRGTRRVRRPADTRRRAITRVRPMAHALHRPGSRRDDMPTTYGETAAMELGRRVANEMDTARDRTPDSLADLFAPDIVLPEQFFEGARRDSCISGEKALMLAVLEDGIRCFQEHLRNARSNPRLLSQ